MNRAIFLILTCGILTYLCMKVWDMVKTTRELKKIFSDSSAEELVNQYKSQISELTNEIEKLQESLSANDMLPPSRKQKSLAKGLNRKIEKYEKQKEEYQRSLALFNRLYEDYQDNAQSGKVTPKMQQDLKEYLKSKKRK